MLTSSMLWFLLLTLFIFVDGQVTTCNVGDATPLRIVVDECEDFYYNFEWEVRQLGVEPVTPFGFGEALEFSYYYPITNGEFSRYYPNGFENDELCLDPSGCYVVGLSSYYANGLPDGGKYTVFYDGTLIFSGGKFTGTQQFPLDFPPIFSITFGDGCPSPAPSQSSTHSPTQTKVLEVTKAPKTTKAPKATHASKETKTPKKTKGLKVTNGPKATKSPK